MRQSATTTDTATIRLDAANQRAEFLMHGPDWRGGPFTFSLRSAAGGFALRVPDAEDPLDERYETWAEAVEAFADQVRFLIADELRVPTEEEERARRDALGKMTKDEARRLVRAIFG